jgi:glycosyltransferase involved in cell wall biosynthesis
MVGRLWRQKNPHCFVEAAARVVRDTRAAVRFFLIGDGELRESLESRIAELGLGDRVRILGWREDVPELLPALDLFVLPSRWEGLSLAILEALAAALTRLIDDAELRRAFGWAGREKVLRDYRLEQRIERIRDFYLQRLANVNSPKAGGGSQ